MLQFSEVLRSAYISVSRWIWLIDVNSITVVVFYPSRSFFLLGSIRIAPFA